MKKILIVEDVEFNLDLLVQLLEEKFELVVAMDGAAGVEAAQRDRPDLILMDMSLPVMDGWEATRRISLDPGLQHIPIIASTAHAMQGDEERARACGCSDYLSKPIDEDLLFEKIDRLIGSTAEPRVV
jgi:CheY-like chemotaxis protein